MHQKTNIKRTGVLALLCGMALTAFPVPATQIGVPLHFGTAYSVMDEYGRLVDGTADDPGAIVQILGADNGVFPPDVFGNPHPDNPVLGTFRIGNGTDPAAGPIGKVSGSVLINRFQENRIFARIFNGRSTEESSFYTDSQVYTNSTTLYGVFRISAFRTETPLDSGDDDGDGLINSWEESMKYNAGNPDTDGDGVNDLHEVMAGTSGSDAADYLAMVELVPQPGGVMMVQWSAVPGRVYQLQYSDGQLHDPAVEFININGAVTASGDTAHTYITNSVLDAARSFRVLLVE